MPGSRGPCRSASTIEPRFGCDVSPLIESIAPSTASAPASIAASTLAAAMPLVSCVWKWIGSPISSFSAFTSRPAARGRHRPAMSLMPSTCVPAASSSFASFT